MAKDHPTAHIFQSLAANFAITVAKGFAAFYTGSGAMLAETLHTAADCCNQVLLLLGVKGAQKAPDASHPLGYGRQLYFWSFMVALLLFAGGGVFSIYEGIHKILVPEPITKVWWGVGILSFSILLEGIATISNVREINRRRGAKPFYKYLRETKDSDLVVIFGENSAATLGLFVALGAMLAAHYLNDARWDAIGSLAIGVILVGVAVFLAVEVKSLLIGESADPEIEASARQIIAEHKDMTALLNVITMQQGPGEVLVAIKIGFVSELSTNQICDTINAFEAALRARRPEVRWLFIEPDIPRVPTDAKSAS